MKWTAFLKMMDLSCSGIRHSVVSVYSRKLVTIGMWLNASSCILAKPIKPDYPSLPSIDDVAVYVMH